MGMRGINKDWGEVNRPLIIKQLSPYLEKVSRRGSEETAAVYLTAFTALCKTTKELPDKIIHELQNGNRDVYSRRGTSYSSRRGTS